EKVSVTPAGIEVVVAVKVGVPVGVAVSELPGGTGVWVRVGVSEKVSVTPGGILVGVAEKEEVTVGVADKAGVVVAVWVGVAGVMQLSFSITSIELEPKGELVNWEPATTNPLPGIHFAAYGYSSLPPSQVL